LIVLRRRDCFDRPPYSLTLPLLVSPACIKVLDDVKAMLGKENANKKPAIEAALGEYCEKSTLTSREKKICYYM
jgi:hypothetical protein